MDYVFSYLSDYVERVVEGYKWQKIENLSNNTTRLAASGVVKYLPENVQHFVDLSLKAFNFLT